MKYDVCLITPTRDRAEAFALCVRWMKRQTYRGTVQWIVVDDGDAPVDHSLLADGAAWPIFGWKIEYIRRPTSTVNCTLHHNLMAALEAVAADQVVIIEDDEHYAPIYVEEMVWRMRDTNVIGEAKARYYHVPMRRWDLLVDNNRHASLCRTAFSRLAFPGFKAAVEETLRRDDPFVDLRFWSKYMPPPLPHMKPVAMGIALGGRSLVGKGPEERSAADLRSYAGTARWHRLAALRGTRHLGRHKGHAGTRQPGLTEQREAVPELG